jgi:hypothetical protein
MMATNYKQQLDPAITRPNRFDVLLCVPPQLWKSKSSAESLDGVLKIPDSRRVEQRLRQLAPSIVHAVPESTVSVPEDSGPGLHD